MRATQTLAGESAPGIGSAPGPEVRNCRPIGANENATAEREMPALAPDQGRRNRGAIIADATDPEAVELPRSAAELVVGRMRVVAAQRSLVLSQTTAALEESAALAERAYREVRAGWAK
jgi:hypothetical protein